MLFINLITVCKCYIHSRGFAIDCTSKIIIIIFDLRKLYRYVNIRYSIVAWLATRKAKKYSYVAKSMPHFTDVDGILFLCFNNFLHIFARP